MPLILTIWPKYGALRIKAGVAPGMVKLPAKRSGSFRSHYRLNQQQDTGLALTRIVSSGVPSLLNPISENRMLHSGVRKEKIRTFNYRQNRVTDHRIELPLYNLDSFVEGNIDGIVKNLCTGTSASGCWRRD